MQRKNFPQSTVPYKPHVVLVSLYQVVNSKGGAEKVLCNMANELSLKGYEITVLYLQAKQGKLGFPLNENIRLINAYTPPGFFQKNHFMKKLRCWSFDKKKRRANRHCFRFLVKADSINSSLKNIPDVDLFISFCPESTYILRNLLKIKTPLVTMYHVAPNIFCEDESYNTLYKEAVSKSDVIQVLMPEYIPIAQNLHPGTRIVIIPNIAPQFSTHPDLTVKKIINIARVSLQKRPDLLIRAFSLLKDRFPDWVCEWWGETLVEPELTEHLYDLIAKNGLENRFFLKGPTDNIENKLRGSSIFAFPSSFEGQSLSLLEAMAMGLPIVACSDCPSVNTMIRDGQNGILTKSSPEEYAEGLAKLMKNKELRLQLGSQAKEDMKAYSPDTIWGAWDQLIRELISK